MVPCSIVLRRGMALFCLTKLVLQNCRVPFGGGNYVDATLLQVLFYVTVKNSLDQPIVISHSFHQSILPH